MDNSVQFEQTHVFPDINGADGDRHGGPVVYKNWDLGAAPPKGGTRKPNKPIPFLGPRRHLTWVRTPVHDKSIELSELDERASGDGDLLDTHSVTDNKSPLKSLTDRVFFRKRTQSLPVKKDVRNGVGHQKIPVPARRRERKLWNLVNIMAGGRSFHCPEWIFLGHPTTLLGDLDRRQTYFHPKLKCYMFPGVLPDVFNAVLEYYQTGNLTRPERLTLNYFLEHIEMFELEEDAISALFIREGVQQFDQKRSFDVKMKPTCKDIMWDILDRPWTGPAARIYSVISLGFTLLSVIVIIVETLPELEDYSLIARAPLHQAFRSPFVIINTVCFAFFSVEFILRLTFCPSWRLFLRTWTNWTDFIALLPYIVVFALLLTHQAGIMSVSVFNALRGMRLILISRVLGTSRFYRHHWIVMLFLTLWNNVRTLFVLFFLMITCMLGFGGLMYALEGIGQETANIPSIPVGMWWAVITMTTVGYGDVVPQKAAGQVTAILCGCFGLVFTGFVLESMTYEYHRLMKANSQYLRYSADLASRTMRPPLAAPVMPRVASIRRIHSRTSISTMAAKQECPPEIHVSINGAEFYLPLTDLLKYPNTLLGHPVKRAQYYNPTTGSYYFPRSQDIFPAIYQYYTSPMDSVLRRPPFITMKRFVEEIEFFQLRPQAVIDLFASEGIRLTDEIQPRNSRLRYWHLVLEHPHYNRVSHCIMAISMLVTVIFILTLVLESLPNMWQDNCLTALVPEPNVSKALNKSIMRASASIDEYISLRCTAEIVFFLIETICTLWFTCELVARFSVSPEKLNFIRTATNWLDVLAILPYLFTVLEVTAIASPSFYVSQTFGFFKTMRLLRLVTILKFSRYLKRIQMIFAILRSTFVELLMLCYLMLINSMIFGTLVYAVECCHADGNINSIPRGMYWAWITMLTIGYGDIWPQTAVGKVVGGGVAILGIVFWTLPMTLISDHFANYRRLFEGQEYMMECLSRMTRLREKELEMRRRGLKPTVTDPDHLTLPHTDETKCDPVGLSDLGVVNTLSPENGVLASRDTSPKPLLSRAPSHHRNLSKSHSASSHRLHVPHSPTRLSSSPDGDYCRFSRLEMEGLNRIRSRTSFATITSNEGLESGDREEIVIKGEI